MPANKSQHFVPRCQLRPFSLDGENKAINLFNLKLGDAIARAPVKNQCAGDYYYGEDLVLEKRLQDFEGRYGRRLKAILAPGYKLAADDAGFLKAFWLLQHLRTDAAAKAEVQLMAQIDEDAGGLPPDYLITIKDAVQTAMSLFFDHPAAVADLGLRLVRNRTDRPFISSDNPAVMTNRWHLTDRRTKLIGPGIETAGMIALMPLSPDVLCILYDADLYRIDHSCGWIDCHAARDVDALNEHQVLNCQANLYFRRWEDRAYVRTLVYTTASGRLPAPFDVTYAVFECEDAGVVTYRAVDAEEARKHPRSMMHAQRRLPFPTAWPSLIRWRPGGVVYDSRSGSGYLRKQTRDPRHAYDKVKVRA
jgi:hypothetical protein